MKVKRKKEKRRNENKIQSQKLTQKEKNLRKILKSHNP